MKRFDFARCALSIGVAAAFLAACGGGSSGFPAGSADAHAYAQQKTFKFTGDAQIFNVPNGVYQVQIDATGGNGESTFYNKTIPGGYGGRVVATLSVKPNQQLIVYVGGNGSGPTGGFNGGAEAGIGEISSSDLAGAGGGGASDVRTGTALDDRIVVAGGGGGAGTNSEGRDSTPFGGKGGALTGGKGGGGSKCRERGHGGYRLDNCGYGGAGGTQSAGGAGGMSGTHSCYYGHQTHICGADGMQGAGGSGGNSGGYSSYSAGGGGGGGGGYYGGGGGGGGAYLPGSPGPGGGGAGGSSYVEPGASGVKMWKGSKAAQGVVVIYW
jgi:hypothetical protein